MENHDVIVIGAGLAGLSAARDLAAAGTDVLVVEARARPGGRVEQTRTPDGRLIQLGGEIVGSFHTAYKQLVTELGLTLGPTFVASSGETTWSLTDGSFLGDDLPWMSSADRRIYDTVEKQFSALAATVDPDDPWSHPDAERLDSLSVGAWIRDQGGSPAVVRALHLSAKALADDSIERSSLLAYLRKESAAGADGFYNYEAWENERVLEGSATVALRMAEQLGDRVRYSSPVAEIRIGGGNNTVRLATGELIGATAIVSALPVGPLRDVRITGVSDGRMASLHRQRNCLTVKVAAMYEESFWENDGRNGTSYMENTILGGTWAQSEGVLSGLIPPSSLGEYLATPVHRREAELTEELVGVLGPRAAEHARFYLRNWATDPWTQGYATGWRPGDVMAVGPLHATHEPPFYVCGSDQWVCGYMEGAVRTGRGTAATILQSS
ncbi:FAD-dependent oxidoreductase [Microbacterium trichothecenolyticum]|uniref:FAD-dependent oxidoreductase n=1 Tax=Microbacterium ureisolvens TaxID=2781186 RepID=A0ABS7HYF4_9MICO|nr:MULTISPECIES: NAD(P)/FAD-dependent oxidoreductase [Microbacterium]MBW9110409.1 FAD-dependent oxidoreductase [Microbacterium ureisolvens]MBW9120514.1 FAD-dependent oxidoreductase [Microbacterium trichothecenolyticum]